MFKIILSKNANKVYNSLDKKTEKRFTNAFKTVSKNPYFGKNIKKLKGKLEGLYRYRLGQYRIVYEIKKNVRIVAII